MQKETSYLGVRLAMLEKGVTQQQLAKHLGLSESTLNAKLMRHRKFTLDEAWLMADFFETDLNTLFLGEKFPLGNAKKKKQLKRQV